MNRVELDENGLNAAIQFHLLPDCDMWKAGFTDYSKNWFYLKTVFSDKFIKVTLHIIIPKDNNKRGRIDVYKEAPIQPYDYQDILEHHTPIKIAREVAKNVEDELEKFVALGIITGHKRGDYIWGGKNE